MAEQDFIEELVRIERIVTFKLLSGTYVLVATNAKGIIKVDAFRKFEESYPAKLHVAEWVCTREGVFMS